MLLEAEELSLHYVGSSDESCSTVLLRPDLTSPCSTQALEHYRISHESPSKATLPNQTGKRVKRKSLLCRGKACSTAAVLYPAEAHLNLAEALAEADREAAKN